MENQARIDLQLYTACDKGDLENVKVSLLCGANPCKIIKGKERSALHQASALPTTDVLETVLKSAKAKNMEVKTPSGTTPLLWACYNGSTECLKLLVKKEANVKVKDCNNNNALHYAVWGGNVSTVKECLEWKKLNVNQRGEYKKTPLILACEKGSTEIVRTLVQDDKTDINTKDQYGYTAMWYAQNKENIRELLLNKGFDQNESEIPRDQASTASYGSRPVTLLTADVNKESKIPSDQASNASYGSRPVTLLTADVNGTQSTVNQRGSNNDNDIGNNQQGSSGLQVNTIRPVINFTTPVADLLATFVTGAGGERTSTTSGESDNTKSVDVAYEKYMSVIGIIRKALPNAGDEKMLSIITAIQNTGIDIVSSELQDLTFLEVGDFEAAAGLGVIEARKLIKAFTEEYNSRVVGCF